MTPETQDKLLKFGGFAVFGALIALCAWLLKDEVATLTMVVSALGTAYGVVAYNSPVAAVARAKGLVNLKQPMTDADAELAQTAVVRHVNSTLPPAPDEP